MNLFWKEPILSIFFFYAWAQKWKNKNHLRFQFWSFIDLIVYLWSLCNNLLGFVFRKVKRWSLEREHLHWFFSHSDAPQSHLRPFSSPIIFFLPKHLILTFWKPYIYFCLPSNNLAFWNWLVVHCCFIRQMEYKIIICPDKSLFI